MTAKTKFHVTAEEFDVIFQRWHDTFKAKQYSSLEIYQLLPIKSNINRDEWAQQPELVDENKIRVESYADKLCDLKAKIDGVKAEISSLDNKLEVIEKESGRA